MEAKRKRDNNAVAAANDASASKKESWLEQSLAQYKNTGKSVFGGRKRRKANDESQASIQHSLNINYMLMAG
jgi:hypothetical protein